MSDNFHIDVRAEGDTKLQQALKIAFPGKGAVAYRIDPVKGMIFYWHKDAANCVPFPFTMNSDAAADFAARWLEETATFPKEPDHDGDNSKGWRVYVDDWARVADEIYSIVAVQPYWMCHGK